MMPIDDSIAERGQRKAIPTPEVFTMKSCSMRGAFLRFVLGTVRSESPPTAFGSRITTSTIQMQTKQ